MLSFARGALLGNRQEFATQLLKQGWQLPRLFSETVGSEGSHDDFKPQTKETETVSDVFDTIKKDISTHKVFVYMKGVLKCCGFEGVPEAPMCGFSMTVCRILEAYGARYGSRNVLEDEELREGIKRFSNWPTIPQVFVEGEFVGGCDIMRQMHESGELPQILKVE